ncbi:MAG: hypothetical protein WBM40_13770 [Thiohalocapsa sp.]
MKEPIALKQQNLPLLAEKIACPSHDRSKITAGIVHVGVGGFHRSHQAYCTNALMNETDASDWGICGVGLCEADRNMREMLKAQDYLYTLIVRHPRGAVETCVIGSLCDFLLGRYDPNAVKLSRSHKASPSLANLVALATTPAPSSIKWRVGTLRSFR